MSDKVKIKINGVEYEVDKGISVLQACESVGIKIPHFCYHKDLEPVGTCRMCLVEIVGVPKLQTSCTTIVQDGMEVLTESESVKSARKEILEFLLAEHPTDCPECDQAGECELQNYYYEYGLFDREYFVERDRKEKRVEIADNLILDRKRCILCTRCVRLSEKIYGEKKLFVFERGAESYIGKFGEEKLDGDYTGNFSDICPVGAITDKTHRFKYRNWFFDKKETLCPLCERGCRVKVYTPKDYPFLKNYPEISMVKSSDKSFYGEMICNEGRYELSKIVENRILTPAYLGKEIEWERVKKILRKEIYLLDTVILSSWMSIDEVNEAISIFKDSLGIKNIYYWGRKEGKEDNVLIKKIKNPNERYLIEKGVKHISEFKKRTISGGIFVFGFFFDDWHDKILSMVEKAVGLKAVATPYSGYIPVFDLILPTLSFLEKEGSYMNFEGKVQKAEAVIEPKGKSISELKLLKIISRLIKES